tara:strand:+ start:1906 stop:2823 length:918 start_codon:yes stop_codon:yes gene_type:complete
MKKLYLYITIIFILTLILFKGIQNHEKTSSLRPDKRTFSIIDTLSINKLILTNKNLEKVILQRNSQDQQWKLNDSLIANQYLINLVLKTIKEMKIKQPVARAALKNVIQRMAIQNTKVDIFQNSKKTKTIYVGGETQDQLGTFMMIEGAKEPYITHIPGFNGYLSSRFSCKENLWRSKKIFTKNIQNAHLILKEGNDDIYTYSITNTQILNKIYCESFLTQNKEFSPQEIINRQPFCEIKIINQNGTAVTLYCIRKKPVNKDKYQYDKYDKERFYGVMNHQLMLIQYQQFKELIKSELISQDFTP